MVTRWCLLVVPMVAPSCVDRVSERGPSLGVYGAFTVGPWLIHGRSVVRAW